MLLAAIVPLLACSIGAAVAAYTVALIQAEARVYARLDSVASALISEAELGMLTQARELLREPVARALRDEDVVHVSLYDADGKLILSEGAPLAADLPSAEHAAAPRRQRIQRGLYESLLPVRYLASDQGAELLGFVHERASSDAAPQGPIEGYARIAVSSERIMAQYRDLLLSAAGGLAIVLVAGIGLALGLARRAIRRVTLLGAAVRDVGGGRLDVEIPDLGTGELGDLGRAFNDMSRRLGAAQGEIEGHQMQLEHKVEERTRELNAMRIEAERASQAKSYFLANMSHEIRTPMTAMLGYTDLLLDDSVMGEPQREQLDIIKRNGDHLLAVINGILDLSKIEAGRLQVERGEVDLVAIVAEVVRALRIRADERGLELSVECASKIPTAVLSDAVRIHQSLINLVGNAIKFTEVGSIRVRLSHDAQAQLARVEVIDTGIGVEAGRIASLFLQFEQADPSTSRRFGGTGLGLAITRRLARLLGGDCTMQSQLGVGTQVTFTFHATVAPGAGSRPAGTTPAPCSVQPESPSRPEPLEARILLVEDGVDNQRLISTVLRKAGARVEIAENGRVAVDLLESDPDFDLVLMDMAMPEMDGYEATRVLRERGCALPIIGLTAHALTGDREKCLAAGCTEYATKPLNPRQLIATARAALASAKPATSA